MMATKQLDYYDIIIFGRTGRGKSTLGNKLLQARDHSTDQRTTFTQFSRSNKTKFGRFQTSEDTEKATKSTTEEFELVANERTKIRVLDTPGFSATHRPLGMTKYEANLQIARKIVHEQMNPKNGMRVQRMLYFLPDRGVPEKADGNLQEELKVMYHYFGTDVFHYMVLIATEEPKYKSIEFTQKDCGKVREVFCAALKAVTRGKLTTSPPVVYIGHDDEYDHIIQKIQSVKLLTTAGDVFKPTFREDICSRCSCQILYTKSGERFGVLRDEVFEDYKESKCHPSFVPKYSKVHRMAGSVGHIATLGIPYGIAKARGKNTWPGLLNSDEICSVQECSKAPGLQGCSLVKATIKIQSRYTLVDHTNKL